MSDSQSPEEIVTDILSECLYDAFDTEAAAIVKAVRPALYREVADRMLAHATDAEMHDATKDAVYVFMVAADRIREWSEAVR